MPERIVDLLEVVQVHQHHGDAAVLAGRLDRVPEPRAEQETVGQAGQVVVEGLVLVLPLLLGELEDASWSE